MVSGVQLTKKETLALFTCDFCEISKNTILTEHVLETVSEGFFTYTLGTNNQQNQEKLVPGVFKNYKKVSYN